MSYPIPRLSLDLFLDQKEARSAICPLCNCSFEDPVFDGCGHIFCCQCLNNHLKNNPSGQCPVDPFQTITPSKIYRSPVLTNIVKSLYIRCPNKACDWKGSYGNLDHHLAHSCKKQIISCFYEKNGCGVKLTREEINTKHSLECMYRDIVCKNNCNCKEKIILKDEAEHLKICPNQIIDCPQNCGCKIMRKDSEEHFLKECTKTLFPCLYNIFGCEDTILKNELQMHLENKFDEHNYLVISFLNSYEKDFSEKKSNLEKIEKEVSEKIEKINNVIGKIKQVIGDNSIEGISLPAITIAVTKNIMFTNKRIVNDNIDEKDQKYLGIKSSRNNENYLPNEDIIEIDDLQIAGTNKDYHDKPKEQEKENLKRIQIFEQLKKEIPNFKSI